MYCKTEGWQGWPPWWENDRSCRLAVKRFIKGHRVLYAAPTTEQINRFWTIVSWSLAAPVAAGALYKNETQHYIELSGTQQRIKPKTLAATPYSVDFIQQRQGFDTVKPPPTAAIEHDFENKFKANVRKRTTDNEWDIGVEGANPKWLAPSRILNGIMNEKNMARAGGKGDGPRRNT